MKLKKGDKIKVQLERVPIYMSYGYVGTGKTTERVVELTEKKDKSGWFVKGVKWTRKAGDVKVPVHGRLNLNYPDGGWLYTNTCRYECTILEVVK